MPNLWLYHLLHHQHKQLCGWVASVGDGLEGEKQMNIPNCNLSNQENFIAFSVDGLEIYRLTAPGQVSWDDIIVIILQPGGLWDMAGFEGEYIYK